MHLTRVQTLVRLGAYQALDLTIAEALNQRSPDFPGVVICTASDSIGTLLQLIKKRRVHRLVVVEGEVRRNSYVKLFWGACPDGSVPLGGRTKRW